MSEDEIRQQLDKSELDGFILITCDKTGKVHEFSKGHPTVLDGLAMRASQSRLIYLLHTNSMILKDVNIQ